MYNHVTSSDTNVGMNQSAESVPIHLHVIYVMSIE
jgi:hypothetical protein